MRNGSSPNDERGRDVDDPRHMPSTGWRDVLLRVKTEIGRDTLSLVAAGVAFYAFLSIFPAITALISIYGLVADPTQVATQVGSLQGTVPPSALQMLQKQMTAVASPSGSALGIGLVVSLLLAIYSSSKGVGALITALNVAYDEEEERGFIKLKAITLGFTLGAIILVVVMLFVIGLPSYLGQLGLPAWLDIIIRVARWVIMLGIMVVALALLYAFAPSRESPAMRWISPGAICATILWLVASIAFSFYIGHFSNYNKTYGSAAAIVILMTWFWLSIFFVLIGAEINAELEGQTRRDSTSGRRRKKGRRGAVAADNTRESP